MLASSWGSDQIIWSKASFFQDTYSFRPSKCLWPKEDSQTPGHHSHSPLECSLAIVSNKRCLETHTLTRWHKEVHRSFIRCTNRFMLGHTHQPPPWQIVFAQRWLTMLQRIRRMKHSTRFSTCITSSRKRPRHPEVKQEADCTCQRRPKLKEVERKLAIAITTNLNPRPTLGLVLKHPIQKACIPECTASAMGYHRADWHTFLFRR